MKYLKTVVFILCWLLICRASWLFGLAVGPRVRLGSWNLHNFFDEVDDPYKDQVFPHDQVEKKIGQLAGVINNFDPDFLCVQEVENKPLLERLAQRIPGVRYVVLVVGNDDFRGIQVGFLSKQPVLGYRTHRDMVLRNHGRFSRDCLEVHVGGTYPMVILANHFKSKLRGNEKSDALRTAQAEGVIDIVKELERWKPELPIAVAGDLNDATESPCLAPLSYLWDPFARLSKENRFTSRYRSKPIVLDHIRLNRNLAPHCLPHSATVYHKRDAEKASDHFPIYVDLAP